MNPMTKTTEQLKAMNDDQLFDYFCDNSGYYPQNPEDSQYAIRFEGKTLFSDDTGKLREKFFKAVRK